MIIESFSFRSRAAEKIIFFIITNYIIFNVINLNEIIGAALKKERECRSKQISIGGQDFAPSLATNPFVDIFYSNTKSISAT